MEKNIYVNIYDDRRTLGIDNFYLVIVRFVNNIVKIN